MRVPLASVACVMIMSLSALSSTSGERLLTPSPNLVNLEQDHRRLFAHGSSPFAVMTFRDDALSNHIGVIYYGTMGSPVDESWKLDDRFWEDEAWGADVTSFAWASGGRVLYVATSPIYGTGQVFRLFLAERRAEVVFSPDREDAVFSDPDRLYVPAIVAVDEKTGRVKVRLTTDNDQVVKTLELPLR